MPSLVDPSELLAAQRQLRDRLLNGRLSAETRPLRALAASMLVYLDDPRACWGVCMDWLMDTTGADRVDGGHAQALQPWYRAEFERLHGDAGLASILDQVMDARDPGIVGVWQSPHAVVYQDVASDRRLGGPMRDFLLAMGTRQKLALALRDGPRQLGLLCCDHSGADRPWAADTCALADTAAREVIAPVLHAAERLTAPDAVAAGASPAPAGEQLTGAEWKVARLVVTGLSYKEIARQLDRSCSTVDHQLRSIRRKLGVNSTAKLVRELNLRLAAAMP